MPLVAQTKPPAPATKTDTRPQCKGITKAGVQCKRRIGVLKNGYCFQHQAQVPQPKKGGKVTY